MKTISIDIPDNLYDSFRKFLAAYKSDEIKIYSSDSNTLTVEEDESFYLLKSKIDKGDYSDFVDWDDLKETL